MRCLFILLSIAAAVTYFVAPNEAMAGDGYGCGGGLYRGYFNNYYPSDRRIPYFAEHPPVYYSYPVPRTYGYSPYAYPPHVLTPEVAAPTPLTVINPHVPVKAVKEAEPGRTAADAVKTVTPLVVHNPFVQHKKLASVNR